MALTTTSEIAGPVNRVVQHKLLRNARARCPYFAGRAEADIFKSHMGSFTALWRRIENFTPDLTALSELTGTLSLPTRTGQTPTVTDATATLSKYGQVVYLTEEVDLINLTGQTVKLISNLGDQAGRTLNRLQRNIMEDNATLIRPAGASSDGDVTGPITRALIKQAVNALNRNEATVFLPRTTGSNLTNTTPVRESYWGICHSDVEEDVRELTGFIASERYASQTQTVPGEFGAVGGVRWISTSEASIDAGVGGSVGGGIRTTAGLADLYTSMIFGMDFHGAISLDTNLIKEIYESGDKIPGILIFNIPNTPSIGNPIQEVAALSFKTWHAGRLLNTTWGRGLRTAASDLQ